MSLLIANVASAEPPTPSLPDGDKYLATLAQDVVWLARNKRQGEVKENYDAGKYNKHNTAA